MPRLVLCALVLLAASCGRGSAAAPDRDPGAATVTRVVDGDTLVVHVQGRDEPVRLIGIDTPESTKGHPVECFGKEATAHMAELLPEDEAIRLVRDVEPRDRYDRLLAYVYRERDDLFVNLAMVRDGFAQVATFPPNVAHVDEFVSAQRDAREAGRGLWRAC